jgi:cytochrome c biogenesis protein CcmG/thiol:disulfide interchange protein DsbE
MKTSEKKRAESDCGPASVIADMAAPAKDFVLSVLCIGLPILFLLTGCSEKGAALKTGQQAPSFALTDIGGITITVPQDVKGKVAAIRFWSSKYADKGLMILAVNIGEEKGDVEKFAKGYNISYPLLLDPGQKVTKRYGVVSTPVTFILDRKGTIRQKILGGISGQAFEEVLLGYLNGKKS